MRKSVICMLICKNRCGVKRESESVFDFEKNMIIDIEKGLRKEMRNRL